MAIEGHGYFEVQTANGPVYTRNGGFQVSAKGQLVTSTGDAVMGDNGGPITMPAGGKVSISADGTISSNGAVTGKLKIVEFPARHAAHQHRQLLLFRAPQIRPSPQRSPMCARACLKAPTSIPSPAWSSW